MPCRNKFGHIVDEGIVSIVNTKSDLNFLRSEQTHLSDIHLTNGHIIIIMRLIYSC